MVLMVTRVSGVVALLDPCLRIFTDHLIDDFVEPLERTIKIFVLKEI
jgi:hypothetical protein